MNRNLRKTNYMRTSLRGPGTARTVLLRMAADQERADRIRGLKEEFPQATWRMIAEACGVTERAAAQWQVSGGMEPENAEKLAAYFQTLGAQRNGRPLDFDWVWHGPREDTPSPFAQRDQVQNIRDEFRTDVTAIQERLTAIEASLKVAQDDRVSLRAAIEQQNRLLAEQSTLLARIEHLVAVLEGAELEVSGEAGAGDAGEAPPLPDPGLLLEPRAPELPERTKRAPAARRAGRRRKSA